VWNPRRAEQRGYLVQARANRKEAAYHRMRRAVRTPLQLSMREEKRPVAPRDRSVVLLTTAASLPRTSRRSPVGRHHLHHSVISSSRRTRRGLPQWTMRMNLTSSTIAQEATTPGTHCRITSCPLRRLRLVRLSLPQALWKQQAQWMHWYTQPRDHQFRKLQLRLRRTLRALGRQ
jgi:hypothetical protein